MRFLAATLFIFCFLSSYSQEYGNKEFYLVDSLNIESINASDLNFIDSCLTVYQESQLDSVKMNALSVLVENIWDVNVWPKYNKFILEESTKIQSEDSQTITQRQLLETQATAYNNQGFYVSKLGDTDEALVNYFKSLELSIQLRDKLNAAFALNNIASMYKAKGQIAKSLEYIFESFKLHEELDNKMGMGNCLAVMGNIYKEQGDTTNAKKYFSLSLEYQKEAGYMRGVGFMMANLASIYQQSGDVEKAIAMNSEAANILREINDKNGLARILMNQGLVYKSLDHYDSAFKYMNQALQLYSEAENKLGLSTVLMYLGELEFAQENYPEALEKAKESYEFAQISGLPDYISESSFLLSKIYKQKNQSDKALFHYELYVKMKDSIDSDQSLKLLTQIQYQYDYDKQKEKDRLQKEKDAAVNKEKDLRQSYTLIFSISGLLLLAVFLIIVFNRLKVTRAQKSIIESARSQLEEKNTEILDSITYAKRIQEAILPPNEFFKKWSPNSFVLYLPKDIVAGDFYWMEPTDNGLLFAAADCTGHGVPGAMVSVVCNNALNRSVREFELREPGEILDKTREIVIQEFGKSTEDVKDGMDIALCQLNDKLLKYAGANNPLWIIRKGEIIEIKADKQTVGLFEPSSKFTTHEIMLQSEDVIYVFSDGFADQFGGVKGKKLKSKGLKELLISIHHLPPEDQKIELINHFNQWRGGIEQLDDVCVIGIKV